MPGDINMDTVLNVLDVVLLVNIILGIDGYIDLADMNNDNMINILDIVLLVDIIISN